MPAGTLESNGTSVRIVAVAVLYRQKVAESASVNSLMRILAARPEWRGHFHLILYDNSPEPQAIPEGLPLVPAYVHDAKNGGLAPAYQHALETAATAGAPWLLLLDQDTTLTAEFIGEALERTAELVAEPATAALVPKLVASGVVYSPASDYLYQLRRQFRWQKHTVTLDAVGVQGRAMSAYNSGAVIRVAALQKIGGFPQDYWLDYLDHAVFLKLDRQGYRIFVMQAVLEHDLSHLNPQAVPLWRRRSVLTAQSRFVLRFGGFEERTWFRVSLLRGAARTFAESSHRLLWKEILLQALLLRMPPIRLGK